MAKEFKIPGLQDSIKEINILYKKTKETNIELEKQIELQEKLNNLKTK